MRARSAARLPILYVFLARSGKTIRERQAGRAGRQGRGAFRQAKIPGRTPCAACASSSPAATAQEKTLYYFSTDLSNSGVKASGFLKFCETLAPGNSLIKSASYLLHSGNFTTVRNFLLANSATIIQDDSGIPLAYYSAKKWRFFPFGRYLGPIDEFPGRYQQSYAELFRRAQPIDFGIGYRWRTHEIEFAAVGEAGRRRVACRCDAAASAAAPPPKPPPPRRPQAQLIRVAAATGFLAVLALEA